MQFSRANFIPMFIAVVLSLTSTASALDINGPDWPTPANPTWTPIGTNPALNGGVTWNYSNLDMGAVDQLWYGLNPTYLPEVSLNGVYVNDALVLSGIISSTQARWTGSSQIYARVSSSFNWYTVPVRFTMTLTGTGTSGFISATDLQSIDATFDNSIGVVAPITGDFSANFLYEAYWQGTWYSVDYLFDMLETSQSHHYNVSHGTGLYWTEKSIPVTAIPEPLTCVLVAIGSIAVAIKKNIRIS